MKAGGFIIIHLTDGGTDNWKVFGAVSTRRKSEMLKPFMLYVLVISAILITLREKCLQNDVLNSNLLLNTSLSHTEIRNGNLKAILGLFFSLSRYKQQQQAIRQTHTQHTHSHAPLSQQSSAPAQLISTSHGTHTSASHTHRTQAEMQSR